jgi:hypothetical protein
MNNNKWIILIFSIICIFLAAPINHHSRFLSDLILGIGLLGIIIFLNRAFANRKNDKNDKGMF